MWKFIHACGTLVFAAIGQSGALDGLQKAEWWGVVTAPATIMYALAAAFFVSAIVAYTRERRLASMRFFDIPIRNAIIHAANTTDHSYGDPILRDRHFFQLLHKRMCVGELLVAGREGEAGMLARIRPRKCRRLSPREIVVPKNPGTPEGIRYCLVDKAADPPVEPLQEVEFRGFLGLRVRSRDLYRMWPTPKGEINA